jgi:hypothetical protein
VGKVGWAIFFTAWFVYAILWFRGPNWVKFLSGRASESGSAAAKLATKLFLGTLFVALFAAVVILLKESPRAWWK